MLKLKNRKGQSTVEYILLVTAVIAVMIVFATNQNGGIRGRLTNTLNQTTDTIGDFGDRLERSHAASPQDAASPNAPVSNPVTVNLLD